MSKVIPPFRADHVGSLLRTRKVRGGRKAIDIESYPDIDDFFNDLCECYRQEIDASYKAGCRYIQLDDTNLAYHCDPNMRAAAKERGEDPNKLPRTYAELINSVIDRRPSDLTVGIHLCRGNYRSTWFTEGGYEPVAVVLFKNINVDAYFLEYDDKRSGDFARCDIFPNEKRWFWVLYHQKKRIGKYRRSVQTN